jgi:dihydropteroate synthase
MITIDKITRPLVMGIINLNGDSFYEGSRCLTDGEFCNRYESMLRDGADIIDLGACSTRPGSTPVSEEEEWERLKPALKRVLLNYPESEISIDTFRASVVLRAFDFVGDFIINDISAGEDDPEMLKTAARLELPYIAMHKRGTPETMQSLCDYDNVTAEVRGYFERFVCRAEEHGIKDIIIDPGFGFAKNIEQNYKLLNELGELKINRSDGKGHYPILAGLSRKSMIYKLLDKEPSGVLHATSALNLTALLNGASILRVHDVKEAAEIVKIYHKLRDPA